MTIRLTPDGGCTGRPGILQYHNDEGGLSTALFLDDAHSQPSVLRCEHEALVFVIVAIRAALMQGVVLSPDEFVYTYVDVAPPLPEITDTIAAAGCIRNIMENL